VFHHVRRLLGAGALTACVLVPAPTAGARTDASIVSEINAVRGANGLAPLRASDRLAKGAAAHNRSMFRRGALVHSSRARLARQAPRKGAGEILAWMPTASARRVVRAWLRSPTHRAIVLSGSFRRIGVAAQRGRLGGRRGVVFTATLAG
jgi:uncharacterized protein YkwD